MKKLLSRIFTIGTLFMMVITSASLADTVTTNSDRVPLQLSENDSYVIDLIPNSTILTKESASGEFYKVTYNGNSGWIGRAYTIEGAKEIKESLPYSSNNGYINYKQNRQSWSNIPYSSKTIGSSGCGPTSVAICASGFGINKNPGQIVGRNSHLKASVGSNGKLLKLVGLKQNSISKSKVLAYLATGRPIIVHAKAGYYTSGGHFMALTGVNGNNVYLSNPSSTSSSKNGWINLNLLASRHIIAYYAVSKI